MAKLNGNPIAADIAVTTVEQLVDLETCHTVIFIPIDNDMMISIHNNTSYATYPTGVAIPVSSSGGIKQFYVKTTSGTGKLGIRGLM